MYILISLHSPLFRLADAQETGTEASEVSDESKYQIAFKLLWNTFKCALCSVLTEL